MVMARCLAQHRSLKTGKRLHKTADLFGCILQTSVKYGRTTIPRNFQMLFADINPYRLTFGQLIPFPIYKAIY